MKNLLIRVIKFYQLIFSPDKGVLVKIGTKRPKTCVFYPTCSDYSIEAIQKYGFWRGLKMSIKRISRCHPWQKPTIDPVD